MRRRAFLAFTAGSALLPLAGGAQQKKMPLVGYLALTAPGPFAPMLKGFQAGLGEAGFVVGQTVALEHRWAEGHPERLPALAAELVARKVDLIATHGGALTARVAKQATSTLPIVFETGTDPVTAGLVASMARPGGNLTGVSILTSELNPKRFELLSEMVPQAKVIAILVNAKNPSSGQVIADVQRAAHARGIELEVVRAATEAEFEPAVSQARATAGALLVANDPFFFSRREQLVALAARHAIPAIYEWRSLSMRAG